MSFGMARVTGEFNTPFPFMNNKITLRLSDHSKEIEAKHKEAA